MSHMDETDDKKRKIGQVLQRMKEQIVDLYQYFEAPTPKNAASRLICYQIQTWEKLSSCRKRPAVLILPGGGYAHTSPREAEPVALRLAAQGYAPFVLHYSVAPAQYPTALREAAMAMRYIRENAREYEADPAMVAAIGFSAGGHLCGTLGMLYDSPEVADLGPASLLRPDALGLCYPVAVSWGKTHEGSFENLCGCDAELRGRLSLEKLVRADMPPVFLWHTRDDEAVPCRNALILAQALDEAGVDFSMHIYRHGRHGLSTADEMVYPVSAVPDISWDVPDWLDTMVRFFKEKGFRITDYQGECR